MTDKISRDDIIKKIIIERENLLNSPNSSTDKFKTKNDWTAKIGYYLYETSSRPDKHVSFEEFRESLIKAGALILSALETSYEHDNEDSYTNALNKLIKDNDESD